jgi:hypothetical protein
VKSRIITITTTVFLLVMLAFGPAFAGTQDTTKNRNASVKGEMKQTGKELNKAGKSLGGNIKHGRVARGGKNFGKHVYRAGKHFGKGSGKAAKKTGKAIKNASKP